MSVPDPIDAVVAFLRADADVAALVDTRVFNTELPEAHSVPAPLACIVVAPAGGVAVGGYLQFGKPRMDVHCYGPSPKAARDVWRRVHPALKQMRRNVKLGCLLHAALPSGGPDSRRDPDTDTPSCWSSWVVSVSEVSA